MPEYKFANRDGNIVIEEYGGTNYLNADQVLKCIQDAFQLFPYSVEITQIDNMDDVFHVIYPNGDGLKEIYICGKGTTPGGRQGLTDEQRIQPKAKYLNYVYDRQKEGKKAVFLGIYYRDEQTVFCTWKVTQSNASSQETPISKQIKIDSIAKAMKEGFTQYDKGHGEYACAFKPEFLYFYIINSDWLHTGAINELAEHTKIDSNNKTWVTGLKTDFSLNRIVFGAPGTGKSYELEQDRKKILNDGSIGDFERVTFHPEYSYSQFVGTYKPVTDELGEIRYQFVPGPFMRIYSEALENARTDDPQPFVLLIEEINRAKVAAVFGEVFQLLDRADDGSSMYEIEASEDIRKYLAGKLGGAPDNYRRIKLPDNMFIWATMNSADQGVFPMDTAFKRRWNFEYLSINANEDKVVSTVDLVKDRPESNVNWNRFRKAINTKLTSEYKVNEDKLLGPFFLSGNLIAPVSDTDSSMAYPDEFRDAFRNKVIMYLYEDAARQNRHKLFSGCDSAMYSSVCEAFDRTGMEIFGENFRTDYYDQQKE